MPSPNAVSVNPGMFGRFVKGKERILIALLVLVVVLSLFSDSFLSKSNMLNVLRQISTNAIVSFGMTLVILIGGIDLSVGSIMALVSMITCGMIAQAGLPIWLAVGLGLCLGALLGLINGSIIAKTTVPPFIVTLAMMSMARGSAFLYTNGKPIRVLDGGFNRIANTFVGPVAMPIIYMVVLLVVIMIVLDKTKFGRRIFAVGGNETAAIFSGVPVARIKIVVYMISGTLAGIAGIVLSARMYTGQPSVGEGAELTAIASVVLGGTRFTGGIGSVGGTIIGCLLIGFINNGLNMLNVSSYIQTIIMGAVILIAVYFDSLRSSR
ncbi:MAG: ABC transporter permease [Planctomycetes bacterium]|nr:ABC transporter permease [Planctomycetota bacterium]